MSEPATEQVLQRHSPLAECYVPGRGGRLVDGAAPGITLLERRNQGIWQIDAFRDRISEMEAALTSVCGFAPPQTPCRSTSQEGVALLSLAPNRWWLLGPDSSSKEADLRQALADHGAVVEQGHGRCIVRLGGRSVRDLLAKGAGLDFHASAFKPGDCPQSQLAHVACLFHCLDGDDADGPPGSVNIDLYLPRSYARNAWEWLLDAAGEFGYDVLPVQKLPQMVPE